jgi:hypothetical protein
MDWQANIFQIPENRLAGEYLSNSGKSASKYPLNAKKQMSR